MATNTKTSRSSFAERVGAELNRAERYRVFLSLTVLDLGATGTQTGTDDRAVLEELTGQVQEAVRACDYVELVDESHLAVLLPETKRQDAEVVASRLAGLVTGRLGKSDRSTTDEAVPVEIASYPDTAGAKTMAEFLEELAARSRN